MKGNNIKEVKNANPIFAFGGIFLLESIGAATKIPDTLNKMSKKHRNSVLVGENIFIIITRSLPLI